MTSDQAKGLICCAHDGFQAHHSPDLFHVQQELTHALSLPLQRQTEAADARKNGARAATRADKSRARSRA